VNLNRVPVQQKARIRWNDPSKDERTAVRHDLRVSRVLDGDARFHVSGQGPGFRVQRSGSQRRTDRSGNQDIADWQTVTDGLAAPHRIASRSQESFSGGAGTSESKIGNPQSEI
jgi:hypothetical protein